MIKFSIIIPYYNGSKYINELLNSLEYQDNKNFEVIITDDNSTESESHLLAKIISNHSNLSITLIYNQDNQGLLKSLNIGLEHCKNDNIIVIGQDDLLSFNHLSTMSSYIIEHDYDYGFIFCDAYYILDSKKTTIRVRGDKLNIIKHDKLSYNHLSRWNYVLSTGICISKKSITLCNGFNNTFRNHGEWLTWLSLHKYGAYYNRKTFSYYRRHENNITNHMFKKGFYRTYQYYNYVNLFGFKNRESLFFALINYAYGFSRNLLLLAYKSIKK